MAMTKTTDITNSIHARYEKQYMLEAAKRPGLWAQFIDWQDPIPETAGNGSSFNYTFYGESDFTDTALTEDADVTPNAISDGTMALTPAEYGYSWARSKLANYQSMQPIEKVMADIATRHRVGSIDRILRKGACGFGATKPTMTYLKYNAATMATLDPDSANYLVDYAYLTDLATAAAASGIEAFEDVGFVSLIHPILANEIKGLTEWKSMGYYQDKGMLFSGPQKPFTLAGITFIPTPEARLHLGAGAAATIFSKSTNMTADTLQSALAKKATQIVLANATNCAVGQYLTIGTKETESVSPGANLEQVRVTGIASTPTIDIMAMGVGQDFGLRFDHASGEAVSCTGNVASIPILGKDSILGIHGADTGRYGKPIVKEGLDLLNRFKYFGWYWYGGVATVQKRVILGRVGVTGGLMGYN